MRYRAAAIGSERSNAVGSVELECTAHGLFVAYLGVGAFSQGYAPGALTAGTGLTVPWSDVREASIEGDRIFLSIDHKLTPLNRLLLMHFSSGHGPPAEELAKRRLIVRFAALAAALVVALILAATLLRGSPESSAAAAIVIAAFSAAALLAFGFVVDRSLANATDEQAVLESFSMELGHFLPMLVRLPRAPATKRPLPDISELQGLLPRTTLAIVITLTAGVLGVLLVARWVTSNEDAVQRVTTRMLEGDEPAAPQSTPVSALTAPRPSSEPERPVAPSTASPGPAVAAAAGEACNCARADSLLWAEPIPRLSVLRLAQRTRQGRGADESRRKKYTELDIAIVNNSDENLERVALLVLFYEPEPPPSKTRAQVSNRPLYYEGPLLPGQAIKWSVEAEGSEIEIKNPITGHIGLDGEQAAPGDRAAELLTARTRAVRLHGAMLLAFLNDARAREGVLELREALREDEAPYLSRLLQALDETRVCQLRVQGSGGSREVSLCLHNVGKQPRTDLGIKLRGLDGVLSTADPNADPPTVLVEASVKVPGELAARSGRRLRFSLDTQGHTPVAYEAYADRYDLVR